MARGQAGKLQVPNWTEFNNRLIALDERGVSFRYKD
jgi:hypothetical protein